MNDPQLIAAACGGLLPALEAEARACFAHGRDFAFRFVPTGNFGVLPLVASRHRWIVAGADAPAGYRVARLADFMALDEGLRVNHISDQHYGAIADALRDVLPSPPEAPRVIWHGRNEVTPMSPEQRAEATPMSPEQRAEATPMSPEQRAEAIAQIRTWASSDSWHLSDEGHADASQHMAERFTVRRERDSLWLRVLDAALVGSGAVVGALLAWRLLV